LCVKNVAALTRVPSVEGTRKPDSSGSGVPGGSAMAISATLA
jgi:hypothetical protein